MIDFARASSLPLRTKGTPQLSGFRPDMTTRDRAVAAIIKELRQPTGLIDFCTDWPSGHLVTPLEIWIERLGCWLRTDCSYVSMDLARGVHRFGWWDRRRLRRAYRAWRKANLKGGMS